jgi:uncharacterized protein YaeQ
MEEYDNTELRRVLELLEYGKREAKRIKKAREAAAKGQKYDPDDDISEIWTPQTDEEKQAKFMAAQKQFGQAAPISPGFKDAINVIEALKKKHGLN